MSTDNTVTQENTAEQGQVKTTLIIPALLWREVKKAAVDVPCSAQQFVIDTLAEKLGLKKAA